MSIYAEYVEQCKRAVEDEEAFENFKQNSSYNQILEHVSESLGQDYLKKITKECDYLIKYFEKFKENDLIGNPRRYEYGRFGLVSPSTLRYIHVAGQLMERFGNFRSMHIIEIGAGYGGQCKILSDISPCASYTIVDLPEVNALCKKYLSRLGIENVIFVDEGSLSNLKESYDLLISNYAYTELSRIKQLKYFDLIKSAKCGYMTGYFCDSIGLSEQEFLASAAPYKIPINWEIEQPMSYYRNRIFTWDHSSKR